MIVQVDYPLGADSEDVAGRVYYDIRNELVKSFIDNIDSWIDVHNGRLKMFDKKYRILDETGKELATGMSIEMANAFIRWYNCEFFYEHPRLTIEEADNQEEPGQLDYSDVYG